MKKVQTLSVSLPEGADKIRTSIVNGNVEITYTIATTEAETDNNEKYFSMVEASKLSVNDEFLQYKPKTQKQIDFKEMVVKAIKSGLSDFKAQTIDPSVDLEGNIYYKPGSKPGVCYSANWWYENATKVIPGKSRQGTTDERIAFLAVLIKKGLATWSQICDHSEEIGHYWYSKDAKHDFEETGSRPLGKFCDLANTFKITKNKVYSFSLVGSHCYDYDNNFSLASVLDVGFPLLGYNNSVGWLVIEM